ncbi:hypothetical protein D3C86_1834720 [compost metagenome]
MQRPTTQLAEAQRIADLQLTGRVTELAGLATIEVKLEKAVIFGQAGQGIRSRHVPRPQHQVLTGPVAQRPLRSQAQAQHTGAQPVDRRDLGGAAILLRVEGVHL